MFSDIYKSRQIADWLCLEVEGKVVSRIESNADDSLIGGNAAAEGCERSFTEEACKKYKKDDMKSTKGKLEKQTPERIKTFMTGAAVQIKHILASFKNYEFFIDENTSPDGMVALLDYCEGGVTPYMIFFKDGLAMEKC
ncbi:hypothetical protein MC885_012150 [Smutsia gigantea]|nr:hypothetical protein MC885_012150 [Smutsia gigantea]